jgi:heavy metal translocating P-type ATPase
MRTLRSYGDLTLFFSTLVLLVAGAVGYALDMPVLRDGSWYAATAVGLVMSVAWMIQSLRARQFGVDVIAVLALVGALVVDEPFAGAMIAVMLATGRLLESRASRRAQRDLSLLVQRAPRTARRIEPAGAVEIPVGEVRRGDHLLVGPGEVVPVDGRLLTAAVLDESSLTGEPMPVDRPGGDGVRSGAVNAGSAIDMTATADAASSTYSQIVRLVEQAQAGSAPFVRSADRIAIVFVPFTLLLAGAAWLIGGDATPAVAVLVVATPCPLILAAPIAIMSGLSRAARSGVIVKGGEALERLASGRVLLLDKTGTVTRGEPVVIDIATAGPGVDGAELLRLAASVDQFSPHVLAGAIVKAAGARGLPLTLPQQVQERSGYGIEGVVDGRRVQVGKPSWIAPPAANGAGPEWIELVRRRAAVNSSLTVFVGIDGVPSGAFILEDPVRPDARRMLHTLHAAGIERTVLLTGDRAEVAETVGQLVGVDAVVGDTDPAGKVAQVLAESAAAPTIMVGDGVNDAPALAAAGVGVALAAGGATASSEAADVVLTVDRIDRLADAILIARRSRRIAVQAAVTGMGLSLVAMVAAALGYLPPAVGALLQEFIDVLAILVALRAVLPGRRQTPVMVAEDAEVAGRLLSEHLSVRPVVERIAAVADALAPTPAALADVRRLVDVLESDLLPHEHHEEQELFPLMDRMFGDHDATAGLSRTHTEIDVQVDRLRRILAGIPTGSLSPADLPELRRTLYGLYGVLKLHNAQEEESLFSLLPPDGAGASAAAAAGSVQQKPADRIA